MRTKKKSRQLVDSIDWAYVTVEDAREAGQVIKRIMWFTHDSEDPMAIEVLERLKKTAEEREKRENS